MRGLMLCVASAALIAQANAAPATPADVVAAEREFAADGQARGWIAAFKKYAAPDAIAFQPDPVNVQQSFKDQPDEPADRSLKWWPVWAGIARSGDLGFTTGPYTAGEGRFGHYFTVWAKQPNGSWRWIYDGGPRNEAPSPLGPETEPVHLPVSTAASGSADKAWAEVAEVETKFAAAAKQNSKAAYLVHLSADARIMGSPALPATTAPEHAAELDRRAASIEFGALGGRASRAGDLVYTYGDAKWQREGQARRGHYVRIWQKRGEGWKLVFDELLAVPSPRS
jgi:ketosteroid isomerase-like protein